MVFSRTSHASALPLPAVHTPAHRCHDAATMSAPEPPSKTPAQTLSILSSHGNPWP